MASRRNLYQPASKKVRPKERRSKLAQGQLTCHTAQESLSPPRHLNSTTLSQKSDKEYKTAESFTIISSPYRNEGTKTPDPNITPRKRIPKEIESPGPGKPSKTKELEVSDSEQELSNSPMLMALPDGQSELIKHSTPPNILVVDATRQTCSPDKTEVDIMMGFRHSPVKVINHSPHGVAGNLRETGDVEEACHVAVDQVPHVNVIKSADYRKEYKAHHRVIRGGTIAGSPKDFSSHAVRTMEMSQVISPISSDVEDAPKSEAGSMVSETSVSTRKKKVGSVVSSRYMTSATNRAKGKRNNIKGDGSIFPPPISRLHTNCPSPKPKSTKKSKHNAMSTPSTSLTSFDISAISAISDTSARYNIRHKLQMSHPAGALHLNDQRDDNYLHQKRERDTEGREVSQEELELLYSNYVQWMYLDTLAEKSLAAQEKDSMSQLASLWHENENLKNKKNELDMELNCLRHCNKLDQSLAIQQEGLAPISDKISEIRQQHKTLAQALDATRHQVAALGVHLPKNMDQLQDSLLDALTESDSLLQDCNISDVPQLKSTSSAMKYLEIVTKEEVDELKKCQGLLKEAFDKTVHETSLKIQSIEEQA